MKEFMHPLQPDVDLLYGIQEEGKSRGPLTGIEVKIFKYQRGKPTPKTTFPRRGYYSGIDQALSLLTFGFDYVYLWHVFIAPENIRAEFKIKYGERFSTKIFVEQLDSIPIYTESALDIIPSPLGYTSTLLLIDRFNILFHFFQPKRAIRKPLLNPLLEKDEMVMKRRKILLEQLLKP